MPHPGSSKKTVELMKNDREKKFTAGLLQWNSTKNDRKMPWKGEKNPYRIWLSEIILQQTRVDQGWKYYELFINKYPTVKHLARAPDEEVIKLWEGLGYYNRCRNLLATARYIAGVLNGRFPESYTELLALKGIGPYTAAAISSFAFNEPRAVVDGNVYRVLSRYFSLPHSIDNSAGKRAFSELAQLLIHKREPGTYNQAIMDFGALICKPKPVCSECPLMKHCSAFSEKKQLLYPLKNSKPARIKRYFNYLVIENQTQVLIRKRNQKDIWEGLHEFVLMEKDAPMTQNDMQQVDFLRKNKSVALAFISTSSSSQHLTHQTIIGVFTQVRVEKLPKLAGYKRINKSELGKLAFPGLLQKQVANFQVD